MARKIGVIGSGTVGETLANGFLKHGYEVMRGSRSAQKLGEWQQKLGPRATIGSVADTAKFGEIIVLAVKGSAAEDALKACKPGNLEGKTVIDVTNPIADKPPDNGVLALFTTHDQSLLERLQKQAPKVNFVKAFSCVGAGLMVDPDFGGQKPTMFICGNDGKSKQAVAAIVGQFGWEVEDLGGAAAARAIEPLCMLWCIPGLLRNQWNHAFKLLKQNGKR